MTKLPLILGVTLLCGSKLPAQNLFPASQATSSNKPLALAAQPHTNVVTMEQLQVAVRSNVWTASEAQLLAGLLEKDESLQLPANTHILITNLTPYLLKASDLKELQALFNKSSETVFKGIDVVRAAEANSVIFVSVTLTNTTRYLTGDMFYFWKSPQQGWKELARIKHRY